MSIVVVNIKDPHDVFGGRPRGNRHPEWIKPGEYGWLGNPHPVGWCDICGKTHNREDAIAEHKKYLWFRIQHEPDFRSALMALGNQRIACYCAPKSCHLGNIKDWQEAGCPIALANAK